LVDEVKEGRTELGIRRESLEKGTGYRNIFKVN